MQTTNKRCHHCTVHQNWFRFLNNGSLIIGLALAFLSILVAQLVVNFLGSKKAEINVSILDDGNLHTIFMIFNNPENIDGEDPFKTNDEDLTHPSTEATAKARKK